MRLLGLVYLLLNGDGRSGGVKHQLGSHQRGDEQMRSKVGSADDKVGADSRAVDS